MSEFKITVAVNEPSKQIALSYELAGEKLGPFVGDLALLRTVVDDPPPELLALMPPAQAEKFKTDMHDIIADIEKTFAEYDRDHPPT